MNDKQLRAFLRVAESKSFSKAETQLFLTRQAIQKQIVSLETELGESLFYTSRSGVVLTPFGEYFFPHAKKMLTEHDNIVRACAQHIKEGLSIRIGSSFERTPYILNRILESFREEYPDSSINMQYVSFDDKVQYLHLDTINLAVDYIEPVWQDQDFEFFTLCKVPYTCFVSEHSDLAGREMITLEDLQGRNVGLWYPGHKELEKTLANSNLKININKVERNNIMEILSTCYNDGIFISKSDSFQNDVSLKRIPFDDRYILTIALIFKAPASIAVKNFLSVATKCKIDEGM